MKYIKLFESFLNEVYDGDSGWSKRTSYLHGGTENKNSDITIKHVDSKKYRFNDDNTKVNLYGFWFEVQNDGTGKKFAFIDQLPGGHDDKNVRNLQVYLDENDVDIKNAEINMPISIINRLNLFKLTKEEYNDIDKVSSILRQWYTAMSDEQSENFAKQYLEIKNKK